MEKLFECCCTSTEQIDYARKHGARRIELCENLEVGGVTPSRELLNEAMQVSDIPVNVLIRPRGGSFVFDESEVQ